MLVLLVGTFFFCEFSKHFIILLLTDSEYITFNQDINPFIISQGEIYTNEINISKYYFMKIS